MALVPGSTAGPYRIIEPLGRGGMASVYRAYEPKLDRYVALKVLPREFLRARAVAILRGVADALDYAHGQGMVHRDVKPQNVLLDDAGHVYLADFGLAKMFESSGGLTASGMITGTPHYMAPEQATGLKIEPPADVYALGIVAYELFTGRPASDSRARHPDNAPAPGDSDDSAPRADAASRRGSRSRAPGRRPR